jgi:hypothetical protein
VKFPIFLLLVMIQASGQSTNAVNPAQPAQPVTVKGHHIGETVIEFLKTENASDQLSYCRDLLSDPKTPKKMAGDVVLTAKVEQCTSLANVLQTGAGTIGAATLKMQIPGSASFDQRKLVQLELYFWNLPGGSSYSFDAVLADFVTKFGESSKQWSEDFQNGYGARFTYRRAAWTTDDLIVVLTELEHGSVTAKIMDRAFAEKAARDEQAKHKNVLDR